MFILTLKTNRNILSPEGWETLEIPFYSYIFVLKYDGIKIACHQEDGNIVLGQKTRSHLSATYHDAFMLSIQFDHSQRRLCLQTGSLFFSHIYYFFNSQNFVCATDVLRMAKAGIELKENSAAIAEQFAFRHLLPPRTMFKDIHKMFIEETISFSIGTNGLINFQSHIPCTEIKTNPTGKRESVVKIRHLLESSLNNFRSDASRVAILFSGGLDSTILYRMVSSTIGPVTAYSASYPVLDARGDVEGAYARSAAAWLKAKHKHYIPTLEEYLLGVVDAIWEVQTPLAMLQSVLIHLLVKNIIGEKENILFTGQGFDTLLGSDLETRVYFQQRLIFRILQTKPFLDSIEIISRLFGKKYLFKQLSQPLTSRVDDFLNPGNVFGQVDFSGNREWIANHFHEDFGKNKKNFLHHLGALDTFQKLLLYHWFSASADTQSKWTHLSIRQGKFLYCPIKSREMREYTAGLAPSLKYIDHKYLVKQLADTLGIPAAFIQRKKSSFGLQPDAWAVPGGIFDAFLPLCQDYFPFDEIKGLQSLDKSKAFTFWGLINYSIWKKLFIEKIPIEKIKDCVRDEFNRLSAKTR